MMNKSKIEKRLLGQPLNYNTKVDGLPSAQVLPNPMLCVRLSHGRKKPYTEIGISRVKCFRCDNKANFQWNICSDGNLFRPICVHCDIELNTVVLKFMKFPDWKEKSEKYKAKKLQAVSKR